MNRRNFVLSASAGLALVGYRARAQSGQILTSELTGAQVDLADSGLIVKEQHLDVDGSEHIHFEVPSTFVDIYFWPPENEPAYQFLDGLAGMSASIYPDFELVDHMEGDDGGYFMFTYGESMGYYEYQLDAYGDFDLMVLIQTPNEIFLEMFTEMQKIQLDGFPPMLFTEESGVEELATTRLASATADTETESSGAAVGTSRSTRSTSSSNSSETESDDASDTGNTRSTRSSRSSSDEGDDEDEGTTTTRTSRSASEDDDDDANSGNTRTSRSASVDEDDEGAGAGNTRSSRSASVNDDNDENATSSQTSRTSTSESGGDAVEQVQNHREEFLASYDQFLLDLNGAADATLTPAEQGAHWDAMEVQAESWRDYPATAATVQFSAEQASLEAAYLDWADGIAALGEEFQLLSTGRSDADQFVDAYEAWMVLDDALLDELSTASAGRPIRTRARKTSFSFMRKMAMMV